MACRWRPLAVGQGKVKETWVIPCEVGFVDTVGME